jgi:diguanylate cyclase (GGDEF)-like protein
VRIYRWLLRLAGLVGMASVVAGVTGLVYSAEAGGAAWYLSGGAGGLVAAGLAAAICALLLDSTESELLRMRHERDIIGAERDALRSRLHGVERRAESLTLVREIHRSTNIVARGERLRQILTVIGQLGDRVEATLFASSDRPHETEQLRPAAYLRTDTTGDVFLRFDRPVPDGAALVVVDAVVAIAGARREFAADLQADADRVGRIEATLNDGGARKADETLSSLLATVDLDCSVAAAALEHGQVLRSQDQANESRELLYPLAAEGRPVGVLRVRLPDRDTRLEHSAATGQGMSELEEVLSECARHVALALKKEADVDRAQIDGLTGLLMKREFEPRLGEVLAAAGEQKRAVALLVIDIDHFKRVNDTHGHRSGDVILRGVAGLIRRHIRACDAAFRYGGEEVCVMLPGSGPREAKATAERLRQGVEAAKFTGDAGQTISVTISIGLTTYDPTRARSGAEKQPEPAEMFRRADEAVYAAKDGGRNQVVMWSTRLKRGKKSEDARSSGQSKARPRTSASPKRSVRAATGSSTRATRKELPAVTQLSERLKKSA